jgi:beta-glucosidase
MKLVDNGDPSVDKYYYKSEFSSLTDLVEAKKALAAQISAEGTVLLKNRNSALPLQAGSAVTLWGHNTIFPALGGMIGSTAAAAEGQETASFMSAFASRGFALNEDFINLYTSDAAFAYTRQTFFPGAGLLPSFAATWEPGQFYMTGEIPSDMYTDDLLATADDTAAIVVITRDSSEAADYQPGMFCATEGDTFERPLSLSKYEQDMIELAKAHSTKVIVLINADNAMELEGLKDDPEIDAVLWIGAPGLYGLNGVADIVAGNVSPSGRLVDTFAVNSTSAPAMQNFGMFLYTSASEDAVDLDDWYVVESEGIYNGYKYYETRYEDQVLGQGNADAAEGSTTGSAWNYADEVSYPFGYGMSYTTFEQKLDAVDVSVDGGTATVTVTNTGRTAGKSVAELFVQAPYTGSIEKAAIQLAGFAKTGELAPGESETVTIDIDPALFASYDETVTKADGTQGAWVLEAGDYYFAIGNGAHEALNNVLALKTGSETGLVRINDEVINAGNAFLWTLADTDIETYSVNVQNALQDMDINKLISGTVEYTTRADWSKGWKAVDPITPTDEMNIGLGNDNYKLNANGDGVTWGADNGLILLDLVTVGEDGSITVADLDDERWQSLVEQITIDEAIQFIECAGDDIENIDSVLLPRTYMNDGPIGFAYDQIAGYKSRWNKADSAAPTYVSGSEAESTYSMATNPTEPVVAATYNADLILREGELYGEDALWAKESVCICPGVNLHRTPYCARNHEYYSEDPVLTNLCAMAFCKGASSKGLVTQAKHYAFNHQELNRSGLSTFATEQAARENELRCFQGVMSTNTSATVMTAFNRAGTVFAGAHEGILKQIARNEWGFEGGFVTDMAAAQAAEYMNWSDTVAAGGGLMLASTNGNFANTSFGIMENSRSAIASDTYYQEQMQEGIKYWLYALAHSNIINGLSKTTEIVPVTPWWQMTLYAADGVFAGLTVLFVLLGVKHKKKAKAKEKA